MPDRPAPQTTPLADDTEYAGLDLSDLVLDGPAAGGRVWRGRRFVECTLHHADLHYFDPETGAALAPAAAAQPA